MYDRQIVGEPYLYMDFNQHACARMTFVLGRCFVGQQAAHSRQITFSYEVCEKSSSRTPWLYPPYACNDAYVYSVHSSSLVRVKLFKA
jgi:hypothetical protein